MSQVRRIIVRIMKCKKIWPFRKDTLAIVKYRGYDYVGFSVRILR